MDPHSDEIDHNRAGRMLTLPAPDQRVSHLHMQAVVALLDEWEADAEDDNYSKGDAATDLRNALAAACTCRALPHDRRCPARVRTSPGRTTP